MYEDLLQNINYIEGLYLYGSGEMDQLSPLKENSKEGKEVFESSIPRKIPLHFISKKETIKLIKCGAMSTFILSTEGNVYSFGCSDNGALGHEESISAKIVPLKFKAIGISGGDCHGIAYNRENLAFWGQFRNKNGKIGKAYIEPTYFNNKNINNEFYKKVISGTNHVLILTEKKNIYGFGNNEFGQIGVSPEKIFHYFQLNKFLEKNVEDISTGDEHSFLIKNENGRRILKSWGLNNNGQLGIGSFATSNEQNANIYVPTKVIFPASFNISIKKVTGGNSTSLCLTEDNRVFVWGLNDFYLLGLKDKNKIIPSPKEIEFFNKYLNPINEIDDIYAAFQYFYAKNNKTNKVYSWGSGDSFILGNKKEKSETTPYLINHLFFKNLYVSDLALGCSHVAVFLIEKKDIDLCQEGNHKNEISKISNNKNSKNSKARKRKDIESLSDKNEKKEDYGILIKVKEEYITLDKHDQPKLSVKKIKTEKKIIQNKENNKKNIDKKEEKEEKNERNNNNILDKGKKEVSKSSNKKSTSKKNEDKKNEDEKRESIIEKEKKEDSNKKELKKNSVKKEKIDERIEKKETDKKIKSNQKLIKSNNKNSIEKEEEMKKDRSKNRRRNDYKKEEEESEKRNQIKKNRKSKEDDKNEDEKEIEDNEESLKKNKNKSSSKSKKNKNEKNENEMKFKKKNEEENKKKKSKSKSISNINSKNKSKSKEKKYPRK